MRHLLFPAVFCGLAALNPTPAHAQPPPPESAPEQAAPLSEAELRQIDRAWKREWRDFAKHFVKFEGNYYCFPSYDPDRPSSHPKTPEEYIRDTAYEITYRTVQRDDNRFVVTKPIEDAQAATLSLLKVKPSEYGFIAFGTVEVVQQREDINIANVHFMDYENFLSRKEERLVWVNDTVNKLLTRGAVDAEGRLRKELTETLREAHRFRVGDRYGIVEVQNERSFKSKVWRVIGYSTENARVGQRYPADDRGLHLAILSVQDNLVTAVPPDWIGKDISELDMLNALEQLGYTKAQFIQLVDEARREHREDYVRRVLDTLVEPAAEE